MGCDIHIEVERQREDGTWENIPPWRPCQWTDSGKAHYNGRSYRLFSALADCGRGPGPEPRDLPDDISPETRTYHDEWGMDLHSSTWYDVDELLGMPELEDFASDFYEFVQQSKALAGGAKVRLIIAFDN